MIELEERAHEYKNIMVLVLLFSIKKIFNLLSYLMK